MVEQGQRRTRLPEDPLPDLWPQVRRSIRIRVTGPEIRGQHTCTDLDTGMVCCVLYKWDIERFWPTLEGLDVWDPNECEWVPVAPEPKAAPAKAWVNPILDEDPFG